jgi:peptidoglycan/LPS O-acetylase OafA/YrhL
VLAGSAFLTVKSGWTFGMSVFGYSWMAVLYACFLLIVVTQKNGFLRSIANNALLQRLGLLAYGVYLLHMGILGLAHGLVLHHDPTIANPVDALVTLTALLLTLALAAMSYKWFEKPILAIGRAINYQRASHSSAPETLVSSLPASLTNDLAIDRPTIELEPSAVTT